MKKQYHSPSFRTFNIYSENVLAMSIVIDGSQQAGQWTQDNGWYDEDWLSTGDNDEKQGYW